MKKTLTIVLALSSISAFAGEVYECAGKDADSKEVSMTLDFESNEKVQVLVEDGSEYRLDSARPTPKNTVFGDYYYDGYGGSVELLCPKNFSTSGSNAADQFKATLVVETYSEIGHVGTERIKALCYRSDN